ncbi:MAG: hypothetical protein K2H53_07355, partial [Clostridia bacterium]|nr:hypothetical protein [Clostridia bacterium]
LEEFNKGAISSIKRKSKKKKRQEVEEIVQEPTVKVCPYCLSEIPYKAVKCSHCTSQLIEEKEELKEDGIAEKLEEVQNEK